MCRCQGFGSSESARKAEGNAMRRANTLRLNKSIPDYEDKGS